MTHETVPGTDIYGPGTFIDKHDLPVPEDARRVLAYLASQTPGFTQDSNVWNTVNFTGHAESMIPGPGKASVVAAVLHAMSGIVGNELVELRDGVSAKDSSSVTIDTDHAGLWLGSFALTHIEGKAVLSRMKERSMKSLFERDFQRGWGTGLGSRATALYQTRKPEVWYQLHGSLDADRTLQTMGIDTGVEFDSPQQYYDYIQEHVRQWSPDELEMHNVRHGLCGSICYSPEGWRQTEMGKRLAQHPLVNVSQETYAIPTPPVPLPKIPSDRRPLAGIKVLEMVRIIAGPTIGTTLAAFGADVIRVNCSRLIDLNTLQLVLNAGKRTIDLDITKPDDLSRLHELLADVDVFIQGFRYGSLDRKGLGLHDMLKLAADRNKGIVYVHENCYGPDGPFAERPGWQQIGDAASGYSFVMGRSEGLPMGYSLLPPLPISDMMTGITGAVGALMAIRDRAVQGGSYHVFGSLVAADTILLEKEVGLYSPEAVKRTKERFGFVADTPDQFVSEVLFGVAEGWERGLPGYLDEDSSLMMTFDNGPWGRQTLLKPVVRLGDEEVSPVWKTAPVPHCYHDRGINWH